MKFLLSIAVLGLALVPARSQPAPTAPTNTARPGPPSMGTPLPTRPTNAVRTNVTAPSFRQVPTRINTNITALTNTVVATNRVLVPTAALPPVAPVTPTTTPTTTPVTPPAFPVMPAPTRPAAVPGVQPMAGVRTNALGERAEITFQFEGVHLAHILDQYANLVGRTVLRASSGAALVNDKLPVILKTQSPLTRSEAISALETVIGMNQIALIPIGERFLKVVNEALAFQQGAPFNSAASTELPDHGQYVTHIVQLKYVPPQELTPVLAPFAKIANSITPVPSSMTLILRDYTENVKRMLEVIEKVDVITPMEIKPEVIPIKYALAGDIAQVLGSLTASGPGLSVGRSTAARPTGFAGQNQPGVAGQVGGIQGQVGTPNPLNTAATTQRSTFQQRLAGIVNRAATAGDFQILGQAKIIADERTNSLLIFANDQDMTMIKDIVSRLDVVLAQVLIETIIMEVSLEDGQRLGVSAVQRPQQLGNWNTSGAINNGNLLSAATNVVAGAFPSGFSYFGTYKDDFDVAITAIANDSRINVLSRPHIQTSHAVPAELFVGDTVPYVTGTINDINGGSRSQYQQTAIGITLQVTPLINPDGLVVMDIVQNIQQLGPSTVIDGNPVPTTTERRANAKVAVRDRDTIILGGFISSQKSLSRSGVPFLKDLPFIGAAFRSNNKSSRRVELMVLMRPTVLPTPESAALATANQKDEMPAVKQAEAEFKAENEKRRRAVEKQLSRKRYLQKP